MFSYHLFTKPYEKAVSEVSARLEKSNSVLDRQLGYSPIEGVKCRVKSEASARRKLASKGLEFDEKSLKSLSDVAGIRVTCKFLDDIPEIVGLIRSWSEVRLVNENGKYRQESISVVEEQDFVSKPKESGYRSYHLVCRKDDVLFEVQVRTIAMDFWASTEHLLKYKFSGELPKRTKAKLLKIGSKGAALDFAVNDVRHDLNVGTAKERLLEQVNKAIGILENTNLAFKAEKYRQRLLLVSENLDDLKSLAIQAREDVPPQYWKD